MEGEGDRSRQRRRSQRTRQRSKASRSRVAAQPPATVSAWRSNDEGATATAMWCGCWRGDFFEGCEGADGEAPGRTGPDGLRTSGADVGGKKRCEPLPVPGCNKPGNSNAEETVEVVRNHEGGTRSIRWHRIDRSTAGTPRGSGRSRSCRWRGTHGVRGGLQPASNRRIPREKVTCHREGDAVRPGRLA